MSSASRPLLLAATRYPRNVRTSHNPCRILGSSSTTRMRGAAPEEARVTSLRLYSLGPGLRKRNVKDAAAAFTEPFPTKTRDSATPEKDGARRAPARSLDVQDESDAMGCAVGTTRNHFRRASAVPGPRARARCTRRRNRERRARGEPSGGEPARVGQALTERRSGG